MKISMLAALVLSLFIVSVQGDDGRAVIKRGTCTGGTRTRSTLELWPEDDRPGALEVEFELETNRPNRVWTVTILSNNNRVYQRNHRTNRFGDFEFEILVPGARTANITAIATSVSSSERCTVQGRLA